MTIRHPSGLRILMTGAARGIGAATARLMAADGAKVMLADVLDGEGEALAAELGGNAIYRHLDVTSADDWQAAVAAAEEAFGGLDALFNNAGVVSFAGINDCKVTWLRVVHLVNEAIVHHEGDAVIEVTGVGVNDITALRGVSAAIRVGSDIGERRILCLGGHGRRSIVASIQDACDQHCYSRESTQEPPNILRVPQMSNCIEILHSLASAAGRYEIRARE